MYIKFNLQSLQLEYIVMSELVRPVRPRYSCVSTFDWKAGMIASAVSRTSSSMNYYSNYNNRTSCRLAWAWYRTGGADGRVCAHTDQRLATLVVPWRASSLDDPGSALGVVEMAVFSCIGVYNSVVGLK